MTKKLAVLVVLAIALTAGAAWAQTRFTDVADDHDQYADIEYAAEQGWFQGYDDGTFRPDQTISAKNALRVFNRAFPDGVSRADLATILRVGSQRLAVLDDETFLGCRRVVDPVEELSGNPDPNDPRQIICYLRVEQQIRNGEVWVIVRLQTLTDCHRGWELTVRLTTPGGMPSATFGTGYSPSAWAGDVLTVEVRSNMDRWEGLDVVSDCHQPW